MRYILIALLWMVAIGSVVLAYRLSPAFSPIVIIPVVSMCGVITALSLHGLSRSDWDPGHGISKINRT